MSDYQERVCTEQLDLGGKIENLKHFMHTEVYSSLPPVHQGLLMVQLDHMQSYWKALDRRIELFESQIND